MHDQRPMESRRDAWFYLLLPVIVIATSVMHEAGHWAMGEVLGHPMRMSLNAASAQSGDAMPSDDLLLIAAAGPLVTLLQAIIASILVFRRTMKTAYFVLFAAWFMRLAATFVSLSHPNDEARVSLIMLGDLWVLPCLVVAALFAMLWLAARRLQIDWKTNVLSYLICAATVAVIVFADR